MAGDQEIGAFYEREMPRLVLFVTISTGLGAPPPADCPGVRSERLRVWRRRRSATVRARSDKRPLRGELAARDRGQRPALGAVLRDPGGGRPAARRRSRRDQADQPQQNRAGLTVPIPAGFREVPVARILSAARRRTWG